MEGIRKKPEEDVLAQMYKAIDSMQWAEEESQLNMSNIQKRINKEKKDKNDAIREEQKLIALQK